MAKINKQRLKEIIKEELIKINEKKDKIRVQGIGTYTYDTLKRDVKRKALDLAKNAKKGDWRKVSRNGIRALAEMWDALYRYEDK